MRSRVRAACEAVLYNTESHQHERAEPMRPTVPRDAAPTPTIEHAARFLERATFGASVADIASLREHGIESWFDDQLGAATAVRPPSVADRVVEDSAAVWLRTVLYGDDQLRHRLAWCWQQIFDGPDRSRPDADRLVVGRATPFADVALGNFTDVLLAAVTAGGDDCNAPRSGEFRARMLLDRCSVGPWRLRTDGTLDIDEDGLRVPAYTPTALMVLAQLIDSRTPVGDAHARAVLARLARNRNVAPFICTRLIRCLVTSNPSPEFVESIVAVFLHRQDDEHQLFHVAKAILTFSGPETKAEAPIGRRHEPIVRLTRLVRAFGPTLDGPWPSGRPIAEPGDVEVVADDAAMVSFPTYLHGLMYGSTHSGPHPNFDAAADAIEIGVPALVDLLDIVLCSGSMSDHTRAAIVAGAERVDEAARDGGIPRDRINESKVKMAIWVTAVSADAAVQV